MTAAAVAAAAKYETEQHAERANARTPYDMLEIS